ncbi:polyprenyl synthetase family protein [Hydrogenivirga sp.]
MDRLSEWKERIDSKLRELFVPSEPEELSEAMSYYLFQEGKRIRPLLVVAVANHLGGSEEDAITVGCAIEMIHNYSLIHDDLPAMDDDDFRRGMPSCHKKFGEALAILAGDALLTYAFEVLSRRGAFKTLSAGEVLRLVNVLSVKSGVAGMVGGQALDIAHEPDLEKVNLKKTAALFEACFIAGGIVSHREELGSTLERVGRSFGLLFQITDDILDKDGFYALLGREGALDRAGRIYASLRQELRNIPGDGLKEIETLIDMVYNRVT